MLYERPLYLRDKARAHLLAAGLAPDLEAALDHAAISRDLARRSVALAPAGPYAWLAVAWGEMLLENRGAATAALERSWLLAPNNLALATNRLYVVEGLDLAGGAGEGRELTRRILADVFLIQRAAPQRWNGIKNILSEVATLVRAEGPRR